MHKVCIYEESFPLTLRYPEIGILTKQGWSQSDAKHPTLGGNGVNGWFPATTEYCTENSEYLLKVDLQQHLLSQYIHTSTLFRIIDSFSSAT